jgi:DNA-binding MarR family transcriptional regulator
MNTYQSAECVVKSLRRITRAFELQSKRLIKKYGLTGPQLVILEEIQHSFDQPISTIARNVSLSQATVTSILDRLEHQGFAVRHRNVKDKRKVNIQITPKAEAVLSQHPSLLQDEFARQFSLLENWEQTMILASLQRLAYMMETKPSEEFDIPKAL